MNKFFTDKQGRVVIVQAPNVPIIVWFLSSIAAKLTSGGVSENFQLLSFVALISWAALEIFWGDSYFRRVLGLVVLAFTIFGRLH